MKQPLFFKGLNGIRAFAALCVIASHCFGNYRIAEKGFLQAKGLDMANLGVTIFFALSGFLITYLLLLEKETGDINIRKFYVRRILRIWPLYYVYLLIVLIVLFTTHQKFDGTLLWFYFFFTANIPFIKLSGIAFLGHYWSLGVEEQFYAFWPWLLKKIKNPLYALLGVIIVWFSIKTCCFFYAKYSGYFIPYNIFHVIRFDCMAMGGLSAYCLYKNYGFIKKYITTLPLQLFCWAAIFFLLLTEKRLFMLIDHNIFAFITCCLILAQVTETNRIINLENKVADFLGKISYGLYVIHPLLIFTLKPFLLKMPIQGWPFVAISTLITLGVTVLIAWLSYTYYESWFLTLKKKFMVVKSVNSSKS